MRAVLIASQGVTLIGDNETFIGDLVDGNSADASWTVVFTGNGSYNIQVIATGHDSNGMEAFSSQSAVVPVVPEFPALLLLPLFMIGTVFVMIFQRGWWKRRQSDAPLR